MLPEIVVLSGAGISAESGLSTFRDNGGLWHQHRIEDVASVDGWYKDKKLVLDFYNKRRKEAAKAQPNQAHRAIAEAEEYFNIHVVTQNVDDLHERAGSTQVLHLHGLLKQARSEINENLIVDIGADPIQLGDLAEDGAQLRPNVVWFGEAVPAIMRAAEIVEQADALIVAGTSLSVYPAANLIHSIADEAPKFYVDPADLAFAPHPKWHHIKEHAGSGVLKALTIVKEKLYQ